LEERRFEEARTVLRELHANGPKHLATLRLMLRAEQGMQNWDEVLRIGRMLEKRGALPPGFGKQTVITATAENLRKKAGDLDSLREAWRALPGGDQLEPRVSQVASRLFTELGDNAAARTILEAALAHEWSPELVLAYGESDASDARIRLERAERWLNDRPNDAALHLTLARLCMLHGLWGKAESYLDASLAEQASSTAHLELGRLLDQLGRRHEANDHYRAAADPAGARLS
jgi:HemY protein